MIKKKLSYVISKSDKLKEYILKKQKEYYYNNSTFDIIALYNTIFTKLNNILKEKYSIADIPINTFYYSIIGHEIYTDNIENSFIHGVLLQNQISNKIIKGEFITTSQEYQQYLFN